MWSVWLLSDKEFVRFLTDLSPIDHVSDQLCDHLIVLLSKVIGRFEIEQTVIELADAFLNVHLPIHDNYS